MLGWKLGRNWVEPLEGNIFVGKRYFNSHEGEVRWDKNVNNLCSDAFLAWKQIKIELELQQHIHPSHWPRFAYMGNYFCTPHIMMFARCILSKLESLVYVQLTNGLRLRAHYELTTIIFCLFLKDLFSQRSLC